MKFGGCVQDRGLVMQPKAVNFEPYNLINAWEVKAVYKVFIEI